MSIFKSIVQNVIADTNNSSTAALGSGNTFPGASTSTLGIAGIQVSLLANQNCTVVVYQSPDGTNWDLTDTYTTVANRADGRTFQAISSYVKVAVTNNGAGTATTFRLQTALCPIVECVPRALTSDGLFKTATAILDQQTSKQSKITPSNTLKVSNYTRLIGTPLAMVDGNFWTTLLATGGTSTPANGETVLGVTTTNASSAILMSNRVARYVTANANSIYLIGQVDVLSVTNNKRFFGATDASLTTGQFSNGCGFLIVDGTLSVVAYNNATAATIPTAGGTITKVDNGSFNGNLGATYTLDTNVHTFSIEYNNEKIWFFIDDILLHVMTGSALNLMGTMHLRLHAITINTNTITGTAQIKLRVASILRNGQLVTNPHSYNIAGATNETRSLKQGPGILQKVIINRSGGASSLLTLYDNSTTSGISLGIIDVNASGTAPVVLPMDLPFNNGLTYTSASLGATANITLVYE